MNERAFPSITQEYNPWEGGRITFGFPHKSGLDKVGYRDRRQNSRAHPEADIWKYPVNTFSPETPRQSNTIMHC